ncbi:enoyl-CoA hydratase-related protein [Chloroflexota bacterium]
MKYENIIYEVDSPVARIILNRPERKNALNWPLYTDLSAALKEAERDERVKVIIIKGAGTCFSAGHDMSETMGDAPKHKGPISWTEGASKGEPVGFQIGVWNSRAHVQGHIDYDLEIWNLWKPVIAQVHSYCLAGATGIALSCDMLIASDDARLGYPAVRMQGTGDEFVLFCWHVGLKKAKELAMTGDCLNAEEMLHYGVANYVFPRAQLEEKTEKIAQRIALMSSDALSTQKTVVNRTFDVMGFSISFKYGGEYDSLTPHFLKASEEFRNMRYAKGIKAALEWRDRLYGGTVTNISETIGNEE